MARDAVNPGAFGVWKDVCDVCGILKTVTSPRDFYYPDIRAFNYLRRYISKGRIVSSAAKHFQENLRSCR
jgi:hypothetical protein